MPPGDLNRLLQDYAARIEKVTKRVDRLETLEFSSAAFPSGGGIACLETIQVTSDVPSVTFSAINQDFLHLWLWINAGTTLDQLLGLPPMLMTFNADAGANYLTYAIAHARLTGPVDIDDIQGGITAANAIRLARLPGEDSPNEKNFGMCEVNIPNYALYLGLEAKRAAAWKSFEYNPNVTEFATLSFVTAEQGGGQWVNQTDPITSLTITSGGGVADFAPGSLFSLLGVCPIP